MGIGFYLSISMIPILLLLTIIFFVKKRVNNEETKIYSHILISSIIMSIFEVTSAIMYKEYFGLLIYDIVAKLVLVCYVVVNYLFCNYLMTICNRPKPTFILLKVITIVTLLLMAFTKTIYVENNGVVAPQGGPIVATFAYAICLGLYQLVLALSNRKTINAKKFTPFYLFLVFGAINAIIVILYPTSFVVGYIWCLTIITMNFTIENPDAKLVEYEKTEKERAEAASIAKSEFLSSMSHELRTPLNAIVGLSEDIESFNDKVPKEVKEDTVDIVNASNTLLEIIGSILDISKIESGKLDIVESDYAPKDEFESIAKILRTKASEKNLEFNVSISERIPDVLFGDRLRIKQIINNLLSNAIQYTDHGRVNFFVNWLDASSALSITVADTGRGVKPEDIDKLFSKYDRLGVEKTSNVQGTGLGLAITKTLIDLMGGHVEVKSEYLIGTTFSVTIPQKLGDAERLESIKMAQMYVPKDLDFSGKKLLVVDDNLLNIKVFKKAIKDLNFEVDECYNGQEALDKIELNNDYDIIFMDIKMPVMDGEEAIGHLINMPNFKTPVVALTADAMTGSNNKYINMGFSDYMSKPFSRKVIAVKLDTILNKGEVANKNLNTEEEKKEETQSEEVKES